MLELLKLPGMGPKTVALLWEALQVSDVAELELAIQEGRLQSLPRFGEKLIDKLTLKAWSFDASAYATNFLAHPLAGTFYYTTARSNRVAPLESLGWASLASLTWELAEFPENVSLLIVKLPRL